MNVDGEVTEWILQGKSKAPEKKLSQRHSVHHKSYLDWPGIEHRCPICVASD